MTTMTDRRLRAELAEDANVPNSFLNAAQRKIIIDWLYEIEEETSLLDERITQEELDEMRKGWESLPNPQLREEMVSIGDRHLNKAVRDAK